MEKRGMLFLSVCLTIVSLQSNQVATESSTLSSTATTATTLSPTSTTSSATTSSTTLTTRAPQEASTSAASTQSDQPSQSTQSEETTQSAIVSTRRPTTTSGATVLSSVGATPPTSNYPYYGTSRPTPPKGGSASLLGSCGQLLVPVISVLIYGA